MKKEILVLFSFLLLVACSSSETQNDVVSTDDSGVLDDPEDGGNEIDNPDETQNEKFPFDLTILASDDGKEIQIDIDQDKNVSTGINLTNEMGIPQEAYLKINNGLLNYYSDFQTSSFWQKNLDDGQIIHKESFCDDLDSGVTISLANSGKYDLAIKRVSDYVSDQGWDTNLDYYRYSENQCYSISLGIGEFEMAAIYADIALVYEKGYSYLPTSLVVVDLSKKEITGSLDTEFRHATIIDGMLYFFIDAFNYEVIDLLDFDNKMTYTSEIFLDFGRTLFEANRNETEVGLSVTYPQPSPIGSGPGVIDLATGSTVWSDLVLFDVREYLLKNSNDFNGNFTSYEIDIEKELVVVGYSRYNQTNPEKDAGGLILVDYEGNTLTNILLDYEPRDIIIRN